MVIYSVLVTLTFFISVTGQTYVIPNPVIEGLKPKGLRVSIPDEAGVELFAFHGNLNKPLTNLATGSLFKDVVKAKNGRWTYENPSVKLKAGDKLYYWLYVQIEGVGYTKDGGVWTYTDGAGVQPPVVCGATQTTVKGKPACAGQLIFNEDFNSLDTTRWQYDIRMPHSPDWEFVTHMKIDDVPIIENGNLVIRPTLLEDVTTESNFVTRGKLDLTGCTGKVGTDECTKQASGGRNILPPVVTPRVTTKGSFSFRYGRVEMRVKMPVGDWLFPELWLSPKDRSYGVDFESGQVRLAFVRGNGALNARLGAHIGNKVLEAGCLYGMAKPGKQPVVKRHLTSLTGKDAWSNTFKNYTMIWTPEEMSFSVDGQVYSTITPPVGGFKQFPEFSGITRNPWEGGTKMAPFDKEFYVRIGLGVGGIRAFPDNSTSSGKPKPWRNSDPKAMALFWRDKANWYPTWSNAELLVDHVKIWAL